MKAVGTKIYCVIVDRITDRLNYRLNQQQNLVWSALKEKKHRYHPPKVA